MQSDLIAELEALVEVADIDDLRLKPPAGNNKYSADLMEKQPGRPAIGVQGRILDAMCDDLITTSQAIDLLNQVQRRLKEDRENNGR